MTELVARIRDAIQAIIDDEDSDHRRWTLGQFVVVMGLERIDEYGQVEATSWLWHPPEQADWMIVGLLEAGIEMRDTAEVDDD